MASVAPIPFADALVVPLALAPAPARRKLRVGVFADRVLQPRWIVESLAKVGAGEFAELTLVALKTGVRPHFPHGGKWGLTPFYRALDERAFGSASSLPAPIDLLVPASRRVNLCDPIPQLDVAIAIGDIIDGDLAGIARWGIWRFSFGADHHTNETMAGVHEVMTREPVTASGIRIHLGHGQGDRIACASWARTQPLSVSQNRANVFAKTTEFLPRALRSLHEQGWGWIEQGTAAAPANIEPAAEIRTADLARIGARLAHRALQKATTVEQWTLGYRFSPHETWDPAGFTRLDAPKDRFWADPFPVVAGGRAFVFFEELPFAEGKGRISAMQLGRDGSASQPVPILERDYHLSYPFLVEEGGRLFMIPESAANHTIDLYRCVDFPWKWKKERTLVDGGWYADATVHRQGDRWWMFASSAPNYAEIHDELHLFSATSLLGEWKPARHGPVKSDARSARSAGALFRDGDTLYRPAQICAPLYGSGVVLNKVTGLDDHGLREEEARRIVPEPRSGVLGMHTVNRAGDLSVTDFFVRRPRFGA